MKFKLLSRINALCFFASMAGLFISIRSASPSWMLLLFYFIGMVGGGIFAIWADDGKFPNKFIILALISGYLTFLILGLGRIAPLEDRVGFLQLALFTAGSTLGFSYFGLKEHEE